MIPKGTTFCYCSATPASLSGFWIVERKLKYQIAKHHDREGQYGGRQNSDDYPPPKPMMRFGQAQHVYRRIALFEIVCMMMVMVTGPVCHGQNGSIVRCSRLRM
jgi:hypothetical protein